MHLPKPLSAAELIKVMPTDKSITDIYNRLFSQRKSDGLIPSWGDAIVWGELHKTSSYPESWN